MDRARSALPPARGVRCGRGLAGPAVRRAADARVGDPRGGGLGSLRAGAIRLGRCRGAVRIDQVDADLVEAVADLAERTRLRLDDAGDVGGAGDLPDALRRLLKELVEPGQGGVVGAADVVDDRGQLAR
ncbi:hypothetical protein [Streptacidiphilus jiangxiensis]|uniref:hypothetical protein n=1 Tax=Streptacidiphilus jiangxiensis TaxID=235985 RepID=UPI0005A8BBA1|nr:hypothetical protein [Streptacidiphilus jiangxiensis]